MTTLKIPILVSRDYQDNYTAQSLDGVEAAAFAPSAAEATAHLKKHLNWVYRKEDCIAEPDLRDPRLAVYPVSVRAEYRTDRGTFPADPVTIRVHCVESQEIEDTFACLLPAFDVRFYATDRGKIPRLVSDYVRRAVDGFTPRQLSRLLMPKSAELRWLNVKTTRRVALDHEANLRTLRTIAEPLGERTTRRRFSRAWQRDQEVAKLIDRLENDRASIALVGAGGVGKSSILATAVRQLERQKEPLQEGTGDQSFDDAQPRARHRYWLTAGNRLIAGMQYLGQWEERCELVIDELSEISGVLCFESLLDLVTTGGCEPASSLAAFFAPYIQRGELRLVAEATPDELDACRRLLPNFAALFHVLPIDEFSPSDSRAVLDRIARDHARNLRVEVSRGVADLVYRLFKRFMPYQAMPGKAAGFVREMVERAAREQGKSVTPKTVLERFTQRTGLPTSLLRDDVTLSFDDVNAELQKHVIGQDEACGTVASLITTIKAGLNDPGRPLCVFLFCGPTGVGKTELAKTLSHYLFGQGQTKERLVRLDMSEYSGYGAAQRLITQADGQPSQLIKRVRSQPFVVVLLDEVEKAAPEVFDVLLGLLDEGRLTDRFGRTTSFRSTVVIMTSNLGTNLPNPIGYDNSVTPSYEREVMEFFRPEFYNRLDNVVSFSSLDQESIRAITRKELAEVAAREGFIKSDIKLTWSEPLINHIAKVGFHPRYGARPLQRAIQRLVVAPLSRWLVENPQVADARLEVGVDPDGKLTKRSLPNRKSRDDR